VECFTSHAIDLIEAAYDLEKPDSEWLPNLIEVGAPILDHGHGVVGFELVRPPGAGGADGVVSNIHLRSLPADFLERFDAARSVISPECFQAVSSSAFAGTWTELAKDYPEDAERALEKVGYPDLLGITAVDVNGVCVQFLAPLSRVIKLTPQSRRCWQMLGAHIAAAYRLRRALTDVGVSSQFGPTGLPNDAEAIIDPEGFRIVDSFGRAQEANAARAVRAAAREVDRARGKLRHDDPQKALEIWKALVRGRWSMVDWFDTDGRRFVLARPNSPDCHDPRGLTEQECLVVNYLLRGETNKLIAYRLGLSQGRVSGLLKSAMHKLGVKSRVALIEKLGPLGVPAISDDDQSAA